MNIQNLTHIYHHHIITDLINFIDCLLQKVDNLHPTVNRHRNHLILISYSNVNIVLDDLTSIKNVDDRLGF